MLVQIFGIFFHIIELPILVLLPILLFIDFSMRGTAIYSVNFKQVCFLYGAVILFLISVLLSSINCIMLSNIVKSSIKWIEILLLGLFIFLFTSSYKRFKIIYYTLFISSFLFILLVFINILRGDYTILSYRIFPGFESVYCFALLLPLINYKKGRNVILIVLSLVFFTAVLSLSRSAYLALISCLLLNARHLSKINKKTILTMIGIVLLILLLSNSGRYYLFGRWFEFFSNKQVTNIERMALIKIAFNAFISNPITGIGALNFGTFILQNNLLASIYTKNVQILGPHNVFLQVLAEEGLIGFFSFLFLFASIFASIKKAIVQQKEMQYYVYGLLGFFIVFAFNLLFGFISAQSRFFLALLIGLSASLTRLFPDLDENSNPK